MHIDELFRERISSYLNDNEFDCGDPDLNEFLLKDSLPYQHELLGVTYLFRSKNSREIAAYFTVLNDGIKASNKLNRKIPNQKRHEKIPAVKIGRLAVCAKYQGGKLGSQIIDFIKYWFIYNNKTGCRFLLADAYNNSLTLKFYKNNGFSFLTNDINNETRAMKFDLKPYELRLAKTIKS
ncbi:GNAT family N-acetyltransferase [Candidatus Saganbacteria bacterium]|nr:GNAT family N-acetyltransferase [Candidatus Saganbacteria bacterium]